MLMRNKTALLALLSFVVPLTHVQVLAQISDDDRALEYAAKLAVSQASLEKYFAHFRLSVELDDGENLPSLVDAQGFFARRRQGNVVRFEEWGDYTDFHGDKDGATDYRYRRLLAVDGHEYSQRGDSRNSLAKFVDLTKTPVKVSRYPIYDPLLLVGEGTGIFLVGYNHIGEGKISAGLELDRLFPATGFVGGFSIPDSASLRAVWGYGRIGGNKDFSFMGEIFFDAKQGFRPGEIRYYLFHPDLDLKNPRKSSTPYSISRFEWIEKDREVWLPVKIDLRSTAFNDKSNKKSYSLDVDWWINDEVPEAAFTFDDIVKSEIGDSVLNQMVAKRQKESKNKSK
jgi:hypothetical protein